MAHGTMHLLLEEERERERENLEITLKYEL